MTCYFISRHPGAVEWANRRGIDAVAVKHLDVGLIRPGDLVIGTLPVNLAAEVCGRGARYLHLSLSLPEGLRGRELSADEMEALNPVLEAFEVRKVEYVALSVK